VLRNEPAISRQQYYQNHTFDGVAEDIQALPWFEHCSVHEIAYEPELLRYGGQASLGISEQLFCASTQWSASQLRKADFLQRRLTIAWQNMVFSCRQLLATDSDLTNLAQFFQWYARYWRSHTTSAGQIEQQVRQLVGQQQDALWSQLQQCWQGNLPFDNATPAQQSWQTALQQCQQQWLNNINAGLLQMPYAGFVVSAQQSSMALQALTTSHLHMTNNRLGVTPAQEYQLALLISSVIVEAKLCNPA